MLLDAATKLKARERLARISDAALGFGSLKSRDSRQIMRRLWREAEFERAHELGSVDLAPLASAGIQVIRDG